MTHQRRAGFALGLAAGASIGYTLLRGLEALADRRAPAPAQARDPQRYGRTRRLLMLVGLARSAAGLAVWAYVIADRAERALQPFPRPLRLPLFVALVSLVDAVREFPVDYVEDYLLERIYGNSERSAADWLRDRAKAAAVGLGVAAVLTPLIDAVVRRAPRRWPWLAIGATPLLLAFANLIVPTFIMPLFNTYLPLEGGLADRIRALAGRYGAGHATILRFDMSRQTKKANAFVVGVLGTQRIAIADTLLDEFAPDETLFVVAHELGHYVRRDPWAGIAIGTVLTAGALLFSERVVRRATGHEVTEIGGLTRLAFAMFASQLTVMPAVNAFSRAIERRADRFAVEATHDPQSGARAFRRLREQNLAEDEQPRWAELLFASHPSLRSRIEALEASTG